MNTALIIEDDPGFALDVEILLHEIGITEVTIAYSSDEATSLIASSWDIWLIDVKVRGRLNGIEFYQKYQNWTSRVIFFTAYKDEELYQRVRELTSAIYLIKPFDRLTLKAAIESTRTGEYAQNDFISIKKRQAHVLVRLSDIMWIQSEGNYSYIYTKAEKYIQKKSIKKLLVEFDNRISFLKIHKGIIISPNYVESVDLANDQVNIHGTKLPIGRTYRRGLRKYFKL